MEMRVAMVVMVVGMVVVMGKEKEMSGMRSKSKVSKRPNSNKARKSRDRCCKRRGWSCLSNMLNRDNRRCKMT